MIFDIGMCKSCIKYFTESTCNSYITHYFVISYIFVSYVCYVMHYSVISCIYYIIIISLCCIIRLLCLTFISVSLGVAPNSASTTCMFPISAARCSGVKLLSSRTLGTASFFSSIRATFAWL